MRIVSLNDKVLFFELFKKYGNACTIYPEFNDLMKGIRMLHQKYLPIKNSIWYTEEFKQLGNNENVVIIFDSILSVPAANFLRTHFPQLRIIYWFWNHINDNRILTGLQEGIEKWSYDIEDCKKYDLRYNTQFYFKELIRDVSSTDTIWDFCFIGGEKGRIATIEKCRDLIEKAGYSSNFIIVSDDRKKREKQLLPYSSIVDIIQKSRCIVDIVSPTQKGLTLRPLEALYHRKKLLTNFEEIKHQDFFAPENICVINDITYNDIISFMSTPMRDIPDEVKEQYTFQNWMNRFSEV